MNHLNSIILEGNVTRKPEVRQFDNGTSVCKIGIAVDRSYRNQDGSFSNEVSFFNVDLFGKYAQQYAEKITIGRGIRIIGRIKQERWTTADGKNNSRVTVVAEHIYLKPIIKKDTDSTDDTIDVDTTTVSSDTQELADLAEAQQAVVF